MSRAHKRAFVLIAPSDVCEPHDVRQECLLDSLHAKSITNVRPPQRPSERHTCMIFSRLSFDADFCVWSPSIVSGSVGRRTYARAELFSRGIHWYARMSAMKGNGNGLTAIPPPTGDAIRFFALVDGKSVSGVKSMTPHTKSGEKVSRNRTLVLF